MSKKATTPGKAGPLSATPLTELFADRVELARIYAEDGALYTATTLLREVADELEYRARCADAFIQSRLGAKR